MSKGKWWSADEDEAILRLRDIDHLGWPAISEAMPGRTAAACEMRYYGKLKAVRDQRRRRTGRAPKAGAPGFWRRPVIVNIPLAAKPALPMPAPPAAPLVERIRMPCLDHLRDSAALQLRIDRQGLTAGFFGDPPPGRSALDARARAAAAGVQPSSASRGSDG